MRKSVIVLTTLAFNVAMTSTANVGDVGWHDSDSRYGSVSIDSDRKHITVCDTGADATEVWAEYATSYLFTHTVKDEKGGDLPCEKDSVFLGHITVFKLCFRHNKVAAQCNSPIWIKQ
ncbi:hypothetical protein [Planotetraspora kaengkrachanensis]|uniref:Uncharacterized protein n=1 Tax=Planotetraspora kaengkrachanensis TaxID=575193 RepID=A0A8J3PT75_9ACTN|nr:hypothetical protein [Planotetraspora kaengkrachanensis]GIG79968.1 hypothetical protein Pka01_30950 [Planotetraspora kaengkrachanensis]